MQLWKAESQFLLFYSIIYVGCMLNFPIFSSDTDDLWILFVKKMIHLSF